MKSNHQTSSMHTHTYYVAPFILTLLTLVGCGEASSGGLRAAGYISASEGSPRHARERSNPPAPLAGPQAGTGAELDAPAVQDDLSPAAEDGSNVEEAPPSDDSVRCGNGVLDSDELCDVVIPEGQPGACPTRCEQLDACHEAMLAVRTCWTQCVLGAELPCE
jgi:hypothetical protein